MQITVISKYIYKNIKDNFKYIYEVACWHVQYNEISFKSINKLTVYSVHTCVQCGCYFLDSHYLYKGVSTKNFCHA